MLAGLLALAGCGGGGSSPPRLADGSAAPHVPPPLAGVEGAVLTRASVRPAGEVDQERLEACGLSPAAAATPVVERVGVDGWSWTFAGAGDALYACDGIPEPLGDPDRPGGGVWCGASAGRLDRGELNDPRLDLCTAEGGDLTAFAWIVPDLGVRWVAVKGGERRELYEVAGSLPVRVSTMDGVQPEGAATFAIEEYAADGSLLRAYALDAVVAG